MSIAVVQDRGRLGRARALAWGLWTLSLLIMAASIGFASLARGYAEAPGAMPLFPRLLIFLPGILAYQTVGALIAARHPRNPVGWLFLASALFSWLGGLAESYWRYALLVRPGELPGGMLMLLINTRPYSLGVVFDTLLMLLFPTGRPLSRRWWLAGWLAIIGVLIINTAQVLMPGALDPTAPFVNPWGIAGPLEPLQRLSDFGTAIQLIGTCAAVISLIVRLRRARGIERQQVKLLVAALIMYMLSQGVVILAVARSREGLSLVSDLGFVLQASASMLVAIASGIAILRYHLYDIDLIIRRTLVYSVLTLSLAGTYFLSVVGFQALFVRLTGQESTLAVVASTLGIAALFQPLRTRVQAFIDRRFFRKKYDARRVLEQFAARAQREADLEALSADLLATVDETLKPEQATLWLVRR